MQYSQYEYTHQQHAAINRNKSHIDLAVPTDCSRWSIEFDERSSTMLIIYYLQHIASERLPLCGLTKFPRVADRD